MSDLEDGQTSEEDAIKCPYCQHNITKDLPSSEGEQIFKCYKCKKEFFCSLEIAKIFSCDTPEFRIKNIDITLNYLRTNKDKIDNYKEMSFSLKKERVEYLQLIKTNNRGR
jgi:DNA-directed RNA polymerase subunit RPC12/RpoP